MRGGRASPNYRNNKNKGVRTDFVRRGSLTFDSATHLGSLGKRMRRRAEERRTISEARRAPRVLVMVSVLVGRVVRVENTSRDFRRGRPSEAQRVVRDVGVEFGTRWGAHDSCLFVPAKFAYYLEQGMSDTRYTRRLTRLLLLLLER